MFWPLMCNMEAAAIVFILCIFQRPHSWGNPGVWCSNQKEKCLHVCDADASDMILTLHICSKTVLTQLHYTEIRGMKARSWRMKVLSPQKNKQNPSPPRMLHAHWVNFLTVSTHRLSFAKYYNEGWQKKQDVKMSPCSLKASWRRIWWLHTSLCLCVPI